jgi:arsenate reductase (thioredoxin)
MHLSLIAAVALAAGPSTGDAGPLVRALWLLQRFGTANAVDPGNDQQIKGMLFKALGKEGELTFKELEGFMEPETFMKLAGTDDRLDTSEIKKALDTAVPESRGRLLPRIKEHAAYLTTSFDMIDEGHRLAGGKLAEWIAKNYRPGEPLDVVVVCTGNSRRSILGATTGNIAAAYYGMPEVRFHSGGTAPTAFNSRTVVALRGIGVEVEPTGKEAARGEPQTANPVYRVCWGSPGEAGSSAMEATEFSKLYADPSNPHQGFAALMVCSEADAACPFVKGAAVRISMPYLDPKIYDGGAYESAKYAERRDDMGRLMLAVMMQARRRLASRLIGVRASSLSGFSRLKGRPVESVQPAPRAAPGSGFFTIYSLSIHDNLTLPDGRPPIFPAIDKSGF